MLTSSAKAKGRALQNLVARDFARVTGLSYGRPDDDAVDLRGRQMGTAGPDLVRRWDETVLRAVPFYVECKNSEAWALGPRLFDRTASQLGTWYLAVCEKALAEKRGDINIPLLVAHRNRHPVVAVIAEAAFADWLVIEAGHGRRGRGTIISGSPRLTFLARKGGNSYRVAMLLWRDFLAGWYAGRAKP